MDKITEYLEKLIDIIVSRTEKIKFDKKNPQQLYIVCLYGTILEISLACLVLLRNPKTSAALPILVRNLLEAYVDLVNLARCPEYVLIMHTMHLQQRKRLLKAAIDNGHNNPYLEPLSDYEKLKEEFDNNIEELKDWKNHGIKPLEISDKFKRAGLKDQHVSVYNILCTHSHNNITALENRHIEKINGGHQVVCFKKWEIKKLSPFITHISVILVESLKRIGELLDIIDHLKFNEIEEIADNIHNLLGEQS